MNIDNLLIEEIENKDIKGAQAAISTLIGRDRWLKPMLSPYYCKYANDEFEKMGLKFWEADDRETIFPPKKEWTEDLWNLMCIRLDRNYSKEKFDFVVGIMKYLRASGHPEFQEKKNVTKDIETTTLRKEDRAIHEIKSHSSKTESKRKNSKNKKKIAIITTIIALVVLGILLFEFGHKKSTGEENGQSISQTKNK